MTRTFNRYRIFTAAILACFMTSLPVAAQDLADFFGFEGLEVIKIGRNAGPIVLADVNDNGLTDLIVVNNSMSRIEVHYQRPGATPDDRVQPPTSVNEFPEHWRYRRQEISVTHRVDAVIAYDFDGDGLTDLIYAGSPSTIVFMRQTSRGTFETTRRHTIRDLNASRSAFAIADVIGDDKPELLAIVAGELWIWSLSGDSLGEPRRLSAGEDLVAFMLEDYNGDELLDIAGIIPESSAPVRMWLADRNGDLNKTLNAQLHFEMPPLREFEAVRLPGVAAARMAVIERASKRVVLLELNTTDIQESGDRDGSLLVYGFTDARNRKRDHTIIDLDGSGLLDFVVTDTTANALAVYRQVPGKGMLPAEMHASLTNLDRCVAGQIDDSPYASIFVLSESEGVVGRSDYLPDSGLPFPQPLQISDGYTPAAMNLVELDSGPRLAVITKSGRQHAIELISPNGDRETIDLGTLSRTPETILAIDADQSGRTDLLLFTRDRPMMMLYAGDEGFRLMESDAMGQFGLVRAATSDNTATFDITGNGKPELLIADNNYIRAVRYDPSPGRGISPGWQVIEQINAADSSSRLVSIALLDDHIVAADRQNNRLVMLGRNDQSKWDELESINVRGFSFNSIHAGSFSGDGEPNILAIGDSGFAVIRLAGQRFELREVDSWRTSEERRFQHELATGDINNDGFIDIVSLDAGEQMCEIFTISETGRMLYVTGFQVYESKLFTSGAPRQFEPSQALIGDVTGNGGNDIVLLSHDRVLIYPQMMR